MIDPRRYNEQFRALCERLGPAVTVLGEAFGYEILLAKSLWRPGLPGLFIQSGMHGEEPGGPLGILRWLSTVDGATLEGINLAILPLVNPDGHARGVRYNRLNEVSNQAFAFDPGQGPSTEGKVILSHMGELAPLASACMLDLHEDFEGQGCYVYPPTGEAPSAFYRTLLAVGAGFFGVQPDGRVTADGVVRGGFAGMLAGGTDGSFSELFHQRGTPLVAVTETPGTWPLLDRIMANSALITETAAWVTGMPHRVARRFQADLSPPLGDPGGPCQVIRRIDKTVRNPALKEDLIDEVEKGGELSNPDAAKIYALENEAGAGVAKQIILTSHLQYRMDLRSVTVDDVRATLRVMTQALKNAPDAARDLAHGERVRYEDPRTRLVIVVQVAGRDTLRLITTFWKGRPDPKPVLAPSCGI